ncbi:hypothetical protein CTRI78_v004351 [Colletotrichum trifolii]|uniref:Uncharacterized protein n=1 Tax=Colletotrichum trifolii TaxID=5466 RepID=A0A4R8RHC2_COLTR|nr:hypothetical protein CTRI78_v004351 [Colletotrichum trifolii]
MPLRRDAVRRLPHAATRRASSTTARRQDAEMPSRPLPVQLHHLPQSRLLPHAPRVLARRLSAPETPRPVLGARRLHRPPGRPALPLLQDLRYAVPHPHGPGRGRRRGPEASGCGERRRRRRGGAGQRGRRACAHQGLEAQEGRLGGGEEVRQLPERERLLGGRGPGGLRPARDDGGQVRCVPGLAGAARRGIAGDAIRPAVGGRGLLTGI